MQFRQAVRQTLMISALAAATALAGATVPAVAAEQEKQVQLNAGAAMAPGDMMGMVVMLNGERLGQVVDLIGRDNTYNDVLVRMDREHYQMGVTYADPEPAPGKRRPIVVGGATVALPGEAFSPIDGGKRLAVDETALTTLDEFGPQPRMDILIFSESL